MDGMKADPPRPEPIMTEQGPTFFIGELADRTGVSRDAIRYYEAIGVLPPAECRCHLIEYAARFEPSV